MSRDYEEFIGELNGHEVRYLIIGTHAVAFHARPRATKDLGILIEPVEENAANLLAAIKSFFGGAELGYTVDDILNPKWILQLGVVPVRIDLISQVPGISDFSQAWLQRVDARFGSADTHFVGLDHLMLAKKSSGRKQDAVDLIVLKRAAERRHR